MNTSITIRWLLLECTGTLGNRALKPSRMLVAFSLRYPRVQLYLNASHMHTSSHISSTQPPIILHQGLFPLLRHRNTELLVCGTLVPVLATFGAKQRLMLWLPRFSLLLPMSPLCFILVLAFLHGMYHVLCDLLIHLPVSSKT